MKENHRLFLLNLAAWCLLVASVGYLLFAVFLYVPSIMNVELDPSEVDTLALRDSMISRVVVLSFIAGACFSLCVGSIVIIARKCNASNHL